MKTEGSLLCSQKPATGSVLSDMNLFQTGNRKKGTTLSLFKIYFEALTNNLKLWTSTMDVSLWHKNDSLR